MKTRIRIRTRSFPRLACAIGLSSTLAALACAPPAEETEEGAATAQEPAATAAGVEAAFEAFVAAWEAEDVEAVVGMFTADGVAFDPVPPGKFSGSEGVRELVSSTFEMMDQISIPVSEIEIRTHGPVAWSTARYTFQSEVGGEPMSDEGYVSMVWVLQDDGSYRAALFHASPLPTGGPAAGAS